jgi:hypothetical protein
VHTLGFRVQLTSTLRPDLVAAGSLLVLCSSNSSVTWRTEQPLFVSGEAPIYLQWCGARLAASLACRLGAWAV